MTSKQITIKLFYNMATKTFYVQLGGTCYQVSDKWMLEIKRREGLEIINAKDIDAIINSDK